MARHALLIVDAGAPAGTAVVTAPFDGKLLAEVETGDTRHVDKALATAYALYRNRAAWLPRHERIAILRRVAELMTERAEALAIGAAEEGGKPLVDSRVEITRAIDGIGLCVESLRGDHGEVVPMGDTPAGAHRLAFTQREPIGVVVAVSAFNHPLNLIVHQVAAAVAAGCPVIVKPADDTPLSCIRFVKLLHEAGLAPEWCQVLVAASVDASERLVTDARVGFFSFIGSARVGWMLRSKLAPGTRCVLEHGGAAPLILAADANLDVAVPAIAKGGFYHAGQVCVSVQRIFADRSIARTFAGRLVAHVTDLKTGDPTDATIDIGPLIRPAEVQRVHEWVVEAVAGGAELLCGGEPLSDTCYPPTVLYAPPRDARVSTAEIFGPVVSITEYDDIDAAIEQANELPVAFQAAIFTQQIDTALYAFRHLDAAAVMVNDHTAFRVDGMPFAGLRESGLGVGGIGHTIRDMTIEKMLVVHSPSL
ncbi:MAG: aldehyde dehydrogenase family protein [Gammaproteobacteria bacterium]|nr:MAG: aldehyde dehydrogenase family protein [Gammaproteobacteria bacterium]